MITDEQLVNWFTYHNDPAAQPHYDAINKAALEFAKVVRDHTPPSADQTAAIRHIREARMTANAAIACGRNVGNEKRGGRRPFPAVCSSLRRQERKRQGQDDPISCLRVDPNEGTARHF